MDRAAGQSWDYQPRGGVERKHPLSLLISWYGIGQALASHQRPAHRVPLVLGAGKWRAQGAGESRASAGTGSLEGEVGENCGWWREALEPQC